MIFIYLIDFIDFIDFYYYLETAFIDHRLLPMVRKRKQVFETKKIGKFPVNNFRRLFVTRFVPAFYDHFLKNDFLHRLRIRMWVILRSMYVRTHEKWCLYTYKYVQPIMHFLLFLVITDRENLSFAKIFTPATFKKKYKRNKTLPSKYILPYCTRTRNKMFQKSFGVVNER